MTDKYDSVVFIDLDNTILNGPFETAVFPKVCNELSKKSGLEVGKVRQLIVEENFLRQKTPNIPATLAMDWDDIIQSVAFQLGVEIPYNTVLDIVEAHTYFPFLTVLDNASEVLQALTTEWRCLVVATKGLIKYQLPLLEALNLTSIFTDILTPDSNQALKKDLSFYGNWPYVTKTQIIVGDHLEDDVTYPKSFGFKSIWRLSTRKSTHLKNLHPVQRPYQFDYPSENTVKPDAIIYNLNELPSVIELLEQDYQFGD